MLDAKHNQIRSFHHGPVSGLVGIFVVAPGRRFAYFDFIVVIPEGFLVIPELRRDVGQNPNMCAVVAAVFPLAAVYDRGNKVVKLSIPAYQELHIFFLLQELADQSFKALCYHKRILDDSVAKEAYCILIHRPPLLSSSS